MTSVNHSAGAASASLIVESNRQQAQQPAAAQNQQNQPVRSASTLSQSDQASFTNYTVKKGDTLWDIAGSQMGDNNQWPVLFALNKAQIKNPDRIYPGQVLTVPQKVQVAPEQPKANLPSPLEDSPAPVAPAPRPQPTPPANVQSGDVEIQIPIQSGPPAGASPPPAATPPAAPTVPVQEVPVAPRPAAPVAAPAPEKPLLRHPDELPRPLEAVAPSLPSLDTPITESEFLWAQALDQKAMEEGYEPSEAEMQKYLNIIQRLQAAQEAESAQPTAPVAGPEAVQTGPQPIPAEERGLSTIGQPTAKSSNGVGKAALIGGAVGTVGMGATLIGITATLAPPAANLGGYATAQVVAKGVNSVTSKVGFKALPSGPAMAKLVSKVGGPKVAGSVAAVGTGLAIAGLAAGGYYLYTKATAKNEPPATQPPTPAATTPAAQPQQQPTQAAANAPGTGSPAPAAGASPFGNLQPVIDENARPPVNLAPKHQELEDLVGQKKYILFGSATQPDQIRATGVQIWLDGQLDDRVKLSNTLVKNGQSELLGRIMGHQETSSLEIAELMSHNQFPVKDFMNQVDDNRSFLILNALSEVAAMGEPKSTQVISQVVEAYDGTFRDREAPFNRLRNQHQAQGTWNNLPANLRQQIDNLLK